MRSAWATTPVIIILAHAAAYAPIVRADDRCTLSASPLPPVANAPVSRTSLALSKRANKTLAREFANNSGRFAEGRPCITDKTSDSRVRLMVLRDELVREDPADTKTRLALVTDMHDALESDAADCPDGCALLRGRFVSALEQIRDGAYAGCAPCAKWLSEVVVPQFLGTFDDVPEVKRFVDSLSHGPPGPIADTTRAVLAWLSSEHAGEPATAPVAVLSTSSRVRIEDQFLDSGGDGRITLRSAQVVRGPRGIAAWEEKHDDLPGPGDVMLCDQRCCRWPFRDLSPHTRQLVDLCFDSKLTLIRARRSGM